MKPFTVVKRSVKFLAARPGQQFKNSDPSHKKNCDNFLKP